MPATKFDDSRIQTETLVSPSQRRRTALVAAIGLFIGACTSDADFAETDPPAEIQGHLVVHTADGSLVVVDPDGGNERVIADGDRGLHAQPTWSPDASAIAWTSVGGDGPVIRVRSLDPKEDASSTPVATPPFYLSWSPTGTSIAMLRPVAGTIEHSLLDVDSGDIEALGTGQPFYFVWEDSGKSLFASINNDSLIRIVVSDEVSYESFRGTFPLGRFQTPAVIAENRIVVPIVRPDGTVIGTGAPGELEPLVSVEGPVSMALSPDGRRVAVLPFELGAEPDTQAVNVSYQDEQTLLPAGQVSTVELSTGSVETLPGGDVLTMNWSPDGTTVAYLRRVGEGELAWLFDDGESSTMSPTFTPTPVFVQNYLPFADQYNHSSTWWSPDSQAFVWTSASADGARVWVDVIADDSPPAVVANGDLAFWSPG